MNTKRIKATLDDAGPKHPHLSRYILPADAESYDRMVEQVAKACARDHWRKDSYCDDAFRADARLSLRAIGIVPPKKTKGTK